MKIFNKIFQRGKKEKNSGNNLQNTLDHFINPQVCIRTEINNLIKLGLNNNIIIQLGYTPYIVYDKLTLNPITFKNIEVNKPVYFEFIENQTKAELKEWSIGQSSALTIQYFTKDELVHALNEEIKKHQCSKLVFVLEHKNNSTIYYNNTLDTQLEVFNVRVHFLNKK